MDGQEYAVSKKRRIITGVFFVLVITGFFALRFLGGQTSQSSLSSPGEATSSPVVNLQFSLPQGFDVNTVVTSTADLRDDGIEETVLCAMPEQSATLPHESYIAVFESIAGGKYKKDADNFFRNNDGYSEPICAGAEAVRVSTSTTSGKILVLGLGTGGASTESYGFFAVQWDSGKVVQIPVMEPDGMPHLDGFLKGAAVQHTDDFIFTDLNNDGTEELIRESALYKGKGVMRYSWNWKWNIEVYVMGTSTFAYDKALTEKKQYGLLLKFQKSVLPAS